MADYYGQGHNLPSLAYMCIAAQKRVHVCENHAQGGLMVEECFAELQRSMARTEHIDRIVRWDSWFRTGPVAVLHRNSDMLNGMGLSEAVLLRSAGWEDTNPASRPKGIRKVKSKFQACVRRAVMGKCKPDVIARIRAKLKRWHVQGIERRIAERVSRMLPRLAKLVPPRVVHAVWRTIWNGWTSGRRFQKAEHHCVLCCGGRFGEDSIEHYARCSVTAAVCNHLLGLSSDHYSKWLANFVVLGNNDSLVDEITLVKRAVAVYAIYMATNRLRHSPCSDPNFIQDLVFQFAREGVRNHNAAAKMLETHM